ncbi:CBS domain-containing protein [Microbispora sp. NPDC049125]|uniref:CBS domain-containing protein n=1 Tax=Microbispora sp. NPDC049125 TaxID=3154929 RepID=UPI0034668565
MSMEVRHVMGHVAIAVHEDASFAEIVSTLRRFAVGAVTVIDRDRRPVGIVSEDDLLLKEIGTARGGLLPLTRERRTERRKSAAVTAGDLMTSPAIVVTPGTPVRDAAEKMHASHVKQLPVIDPVTGRVCGTLHQSDVLRVFERPLGELHDEIVALVRDQLGLDPGALAFDVVGGVVTITGEAMADDVERLVRAVRRVDGVVAVVPEVETRPRGEAAVYPPVY